MPNPVNQATEISFRVPEGGSQIALHINDLTGKLVRTLVDGFEPPGNRTVRWSGRDDLGRSVATDQYRVKPARASVHACESACEDLPAATKTVSEPGSTSTAALSDRVLYRSQ